MKISALFDEAGNIHALFRPSVESGAPVFQFQPSPGQRTQTFELPAELGQLDLRKLHTMLKVQLSRGHAQLGVRREG